MAELEQRYAYCRVQRTRYDDGPDFFGDPEAVSRAEYLRLKAKAPLKTKKQQSMGILRLVIRKSINLRKSHLTVYGGSVSLFKLDPCSSAYRLERYSIHCATAPKRL